MKQIVKFILGLSFILYLYILMDLMFIRPENGMYAGHSLLEYIQASSNFVPFRTIAENIHGIAGNGMDTGLAIRNLTGNLFMFLPMGIYLPFLIRKIDGASKFVVAMTIVLIILEVAQVLTRRGVIDIDDYILNMAGALMGYGIWKTKLLQKLLKGIYS
ncbi:VanZ family protein [Salinicoccus sp. ID82-1]|uniref:VanZ family protein n=1 Tax=Salinicoccus sp. ID82-1 TaxID=2820269 RepID=UPI001F2DFB6A|nr:VanZ family protein [Salinicoccus sp. ID82-1]MCG1010869.1 VanZ family protein [Salinicoccus sp. ID82-1]